VIVQIAGSGSGTIGSNPAGINCDHGSACNLSAGLGQSFTLSATATSGTFQGWSGACTGSGSCSLTMRGTPQVVTATFN
jgi:hypothetical protein